MAAPVRRRPPAQPELSMSSCATAAGVGLAAVVALLMWADGLGGSALFVLALAGVGLVARRTAAAKRARAVLQLRTVQSAEVARYHQMRPTEFEHAIAFLCQRDGCRDVRVVGGANDLGADVQATAPDGRRIVIQCKRYGPSNKVGSPDLQRFGGTCWSVHRAAVAAVVTTSVFTRPAAQYAASHGIRCVDEQALAGWASRTGPPPWM